MTGPTTVKLEGLDDVLQMLQGLPAEIVSKRGGPVRAALRKGATLIHRAAQANLYRATADVSTGDAVGTGLLLQNLVVTRGKEPVGSKGERYLVRVRRKAYVRQGEATSTLKTAQLLEYGSSQQPAEPWLRPAFNTQAAAAIKTIEAELLRAIGRAARKAAKTRGM